LTNLNLRKEKVVALAGYVGGAKMAQGLQRVLPGSKLTVIVNIGGDFEHYGLKICPDLIPYAIFYPPGQSRDRLGLAGESWGLTGAKVLGGPTWFQPRDRDLGTHLETRRSGWDSRADHKDFCNLGYAPQRAASDRPVGPTIVHSNEATYLFKNICTPQMRSSGNWFQLPEYPGKCTCAGRIGFKIVISSSSAL
jgi:hypothetical protein